MKTIQKEYPFLENLLGSLPQTIKKGVSQAAFFAGGFFVSQTIILEDLSPFGIALSAAVSGRYLLSTVSGCFLGAMLAGGTGQPFRYMAAILAVGLLSFAFRLIRVNRREIGYYIAPVLAFSCCFLTGIIIAAASGFTLSVFTIYLAESVLCGASAYFFQRSLNAGRKGVRLKALPTTDLACIVISISLFFMGLMALTFWEISPGRLAAVFCILVAGRYGGLSAGAIVGTALGLAAGLSGDMMFLLGTYAFAGLMAGLFSPLGQLGSSAAFAVSAGIICVVESGMYAVAGPLLEIAGGTMFFVVMPSAAGNKIDHFINTKIDANPKGSLRQSLVVRLRFAANAMVGVSQSVESVSYKLNEMSVKQPELVYKNVFEDVCANCNLVRLCWDKERAETLAVFGQMSDILRDAGKLTPDNLPQTMCTKCIHQEQLMLYYNSHFQVYREMEDYEAKVSQIREIVADQFYGISDMLYDLSTEFEESEVYDLELADKVRDIMNDYEIYPTDVACVTDRFDRMRIEAHCPQPVANVKNARMAKEIEKTCGRYFEEVSITLAGSDAMLSYCEKATMSLDTGYCQHACNGNLCGDCVEIINDGKGHQILIISDGMGSGGRAAVDGAMASGLLSRLIKAGYGFDCSLRVVNAALLVKSSDESLATLDIVCVDLFTGRTDFYKAGAASSFELHEEKAYQVELASLPAGILREVDFARTSTMLTGGDKVVLFSDGVVDEDTLWLKETIEHDKSSTPKELSERILQEARSRRGGQREDDMTVMVAQLHLN
ncbi:MAG: SpoIIE family protein phosphatase [Clostridiales bacterium]|nr:SpoIIE family protein phosphatase [Clostridiales bacterium]